MDNYIVSARKYRPATFASVVGQRALTATLKNAIATNRLAHAYLFCGSRGVGKTSCARIFAKSINCTNPSPDGDPCNECDSCRAFNENRSLNIIELDAASNNSVDDIRQLVDQVQVPPTNGRYRVFIVDEVHMLSSAAFNAFLKTLEEPPSYVVFILATTEKQKIIPTILSRCQIYDFNRITVSDMVDHLEYVAKCEGITAERSALNIIAQKADGAMRDALSIFDQVAASSRGNITYTSAIDNLNVLDEAYFRRLTEAFLKADVTETLLIYKEVRDRGFDSHFFITGLGSFLRNLMVARDERTLSLLDTDEAVKTSMAELAKRMPVEFFYAAMSLCNEADLNYRNASSKTFLVELLLIRLCQQLSPSQNYSGAGEGQLKPISAAPAATAVGREPSPARQPAAAPQPQAAPPSAPVSASPAEPAAAVNQHFIPPQPVAGHAPMRNGKVLRSSRSMAARAESRPADAATRGDVSNGPRNAPYTPAQVAEAWNAFAAARPKEPLLVNTMRASQPEMTDTPDVFSVAFANKIQKDEMTQRLPELLEAVRKAVGNDAVRFVFTISDSGPAPHLWNDREILTHLMQTRPKFTKLMDDLNLKLT